MAKRSGLIIIVALVFTYAVAAQNNQPAPAPTAQQTGATAAAAATPTTASEQDEIRNLTQEQYQALSKIDKSWFDQHETNGYLSTDPTGKVFNKAEGLKDLDNAKFECTVGDVTVHTFGPRLAVAVYKLDVKGTYKGQDVTGAYRITDVWTMSGGTWKMVASQGTGIPKQQ